MAINFRDTDLGLPAPSNLWARPCAARPFLDTGERVAPFKGLDKQGRYDEPINSEDLEAMADQARKTVVWVDPAESKVVEPNSSARWWRVALGFIFTTLVILFVMLVIGVAGSVKPQAVERPVVQPLT